VRAFHVPAAFHTPPFSVFFSKRSFPNLDDVTAASTLSPRQAAKTPSMAAEDVERISYSYLWVGRIKSFFICSSSVLLLLLSPLL
jgi:hypothetical protein